MPTAGRQRDRKPRIRLHQAAKQRQRQFGQFGEGNDGQPCAQGGEPERQARSPAQTAQGKTQRHAYRPLAFEVERRTVFSRITDPIRLVGAHHIGQRNVRERVATPRQVANQLR
jgi:hypothetical protein